MREALFDRLNILRANIISTYREQTAYFSENWFSLGSTLFYVLTTILFIKILYSNIDTFADYNENEMLFLMLICQLSFYMDWIWSYNNTMGMIESVRTGELDMILVKPVPILFFITFRYISLLNRLRDGVPNLIIMGALVQWKELPANWHLLPVVLTIFICGLTAWHCFRFIFALPVFFIGQSYALFSISGSLGEVNNIPLETFKGKLRHVFLSAIPALITSQLSVSVFLGKSEPAVPVLIAIAVATMFLILKSTLWNVSLRNYSSASS